MKPRNEEERWSRWDKSQRRLVLWRRENPITDSDPVAQYGLVAAWLGKHVNRGRLLDVGCKTGGLRKSCFYPEGLGYHGIDPLVIPGGEYDFPFHAITVEQMDMHHERCFFDAVLIKDSVDYFADLRVAFAKILRVLKKPDGLLLLSEADHQSGVARASRWLRGGQDVRRAIIQLFLNKRTPSIGTTLREIWNHRRSRKQRAPWLSVLGKVHYRDTYPNGDLSARVIKRELRKAGFLVVESGISGGRLWVVARAR